LKSYKLTAKEKAPEKKAAHLDLVINHLKSVFVVYDLPT